MTKYISKPIEVDAFTVGQSKDPEWFLLARKNKQVSTLPQSGTVVAKTSDNQIAYYSPEVFDKLFETVEEAEDLDGNGTVDPREKAIATEIKDKTKTKGKPSEPTTAPVVDATE